MSILFNPISENDYLYVPNVANGDQFFPNQVNSQLGIYDGLTGGGFVCNGNPITGNATTSGNCNVWVPPIRNLTLPTQASTNSQASNILNSAATFLGGIVNYFVLWSGSTYCELVALGNDPALQQCTNQLIVSSNAVSQTANVNIGGENIAAVYLGVIFSVLAIVGIAGVQIFGTGLNPASVVIIATGALTLVLWASLSVLGAPVLLSIPVFGYIIYGGMTLSMVIGWGATIRGNFT